jgi:FtsH-binding integral membrane protein
MEVLAKYHRGSKSARTIWGKNVARNLASAVLLLLAIPLLITSAFGLFGRLYGPNLLGTIAFTLAAELVVLSAGFVASPREGEIGVPRAIAYIFFLLQTVGLPSSLIILAYIKIVGLESEVKTLRIGKRTECLLNLGFVPGEIDPHRRLDIVRNDSNVILGFEIVQ